MSPQLSLIVKPIRHKVSLYESSSNFIPRLKDFMNVNSVNMIMFSDINKCPDTNVRILKCIVF